MKIVLLALALLGVATFARAAEDPTTALPGVADLTPDTFAKNVNGAKHALVEFYAPWCGHCKHLTPEYKKLGELVMNDPALKNRVVIAKVDADAHRELGERFGVRGFPTIKFFARGKPVTSEAAQDYNSARTATAMLEYIKKAIQDDAGFARVDALDPIAKKFVSAGDKAAVIAEAKEAVAKLDDEAKGNGELYVKMMEKAVEKGTEYLSKEKARVEKMLGTGSVATSKVEELSKKASVLGAFLDETQ